MQHQMTFWDAEEFNLLPNDYDHVVNKISTAAYLQNVKTRAKRKGLDYNLTLDWLQSKLKQGKCERTGIIFDNRKLKIAQPYSPSIDRIDSTQGYVQSNCQMVVLIYNYMKNQFHQYEVDIFLLMIQRQTL